MIMVTKVTKKLLKMERRSGFELKLACLHEMLCSKVMKIVLEISLEVTSCFTHLARTLSLVESKTVSSETWVKPSSLVGTRFIST